MQNTIQYQLIDPAGEGHCLDAATYREAADQIVGWTSDPRHGYKAPFAVRVAVAFGILRRKVIR